MIKSLKSPFGNADKKRYLGLNKKIGVLLISWTKNKLIYAALTFFVTYCPCIGACMESQRDPSEPVMLPRVRMNLINGGSQLWEDWSMNQGGTGTCTSHAVTAAMSYVHQIDGIMPNYLHKYTLHDLGEDCSNYESGGISVRDAMQFVDRYGVPRVPQGQMVLFSLKNGSIEHNGRKLKSDELCELGAGPFSFPRGTTKYTFGHVADVYSGTAWLNSPNPLDRIKECIRRYNLPVVVGLTSRFTSVHPHDASLAYDISNPHIGCGFIPPACIAKPALCAQAQSNTTFSCADPASWGEVDKKKGHALVVYGYNEETKGFYVKNSWGADRWARRFPNVEMEGGNALLSYSYFSRYLHSAYVGWEAKVICGNKDYADLKK